MVLPYKSYISWKLGPLVIQSWGLLVAIGILIGTYLIIKEAKKRNIPFNYAYNLILTIIIGGFLGARILNILENWNYYSVSLINILKVWEGGLNIVGGITLATLFGYIYTKKNKLNFWKYADLITPGLIVAIIFGRIGCILGDGGHVGKTTNFFLGVLVNGEVRHLTALYSIFALLFILLIIYILKQKQQKTGILFLTFIWLYSILRFIIDFFRIDLTYYSLTLTQYFCIAFFLIPIYYLFIKFKQK